MNAKTAVIQTRYKSKRAFLISSGINAWSARARPGAARRQVARRRVFPGQRPVLLQSRRRRVGRPKIEIGDCQLNLAGNAIGHKFYQSGRVVVAVITKLIVATCKSVAAEVVRVVCIWHSAHCISSREWVEGRPGVGPVTNSPDGAEQHVVLRRMMRRMRSVRPRRAAVVVALRANVDIRIICVGENVRRGEDEIVGRGERAKQLVGVNRSKLVVGDDHPHSRQRIGKGDDAVQHIRPGMLRVRVMADGARDGHVVIIRSASRSGPALQSAPAAPNPNGSGRNC